MTDTWRIWPKLATSAVIVPMQAGAFVRHDGHDFAVPDEGAYELMRRVAPMLDGTVALPEILDRFEPAIQPAIERLVCHLIDRGAIRNDFGRYRRLLPQPIRRQFASQLALIDQLADAPEERFDWFRGSRVLLAGTGVAFTHCAAALIRNGLAQLSVADLAEPGRIPPEAESEADRLRRDGIAAALEAIDDPSAIDTTCRPLSLVIYASDLASIQDLVLIRHRAGQEYCPLLPGLVIGRQLLVGPLMRPPACPLCLLHRLALELSDVSQQQRMLWQIRERGTLGSDPAPPPLAARLGSDLAFEAFKALAGGIRPELARGVILQTVTGDGGVRAVFVPHTLHWCEGTCRMFRRELAGKTRLPDDVTADLAGRPLFRAAGRAGVAC
jgi:hypothetical protein